MAKKNVDDLQIEETEDSVRISVKNFSPDLLLQQSVGFVILLAMSICMLIFSWFLLYTLLVVLLLLYTGYRMYYNINDHYLVLIKDGRLTIIKGMDNRTIIDLALTEIDNVYIKRRTGKVLTSAKTGNTTVTPNMNELMITVRGHDHMVSDEMEYPVQVAVRNRILDQVDKLK